MPRKQLKCEWFFMVIFGHHPKHFINSKRYSVSKRYWQMPGHWNAEIEIVSRSSGLYFDVHKYHYKYHSFSHSFSSCLAHQSKRIENDDAWECGSINLFRNKSRFNFFSPSLSWALSVSQFVCTFANSSCLLFLSISILFNLSWASDFWFHFVTNATSNHWLWRMRREDEETTVTRRKNLHFNEHWKSGIAQFFPPTWRI